MKKWLRRLTRTELVLIYLVILAGSIVRMTGSGMGCPDWPKCFGYLIPPTERSQLEWSPEHEFKKGQIIIVDEELKVAEKDFVSETAYQEENWSAYTKHDYAIFNPFHTWVEYINRLLGALSGIPMLVLVVSGLWFIRRDWRILLLSVIGLFLLGFEAWLGKLVVDGNLIPGSITIHMMGALSIVAVLLVMLGLNTEFSKIHYSRAFMAILILSILMSIVQIVMGTQVREQVDLLNEAGMQRENWVNSLDWQFYFHRSFSILVLATNSWLWWQNQNRGRGIKEVNMVILVILAEILLGIILNYFGMPKFAQPLHLLLGAIMLGLQLYALIRLILSEKAPLITAS
jgi:cytochrome c oxidase assembly protein subunit 15